MIFGDATDGLAVGTGIAGGIVGAAAILRPTVAYILDWLERRAVRRAAEQAALLEREAKIERETDERREEWMRLLVAGSKEQVTSTIENKHATAALTVVIAQLVTEVRRLSEQKSGRRPTGRGPGSPGPTDPTSS